MFPTNEETRRCDGLTTCVSSRVIYKQLVNPPIDQGVEGFVSKCTIDSF